MQLIVTRELSEDKNLWLRNPTNDLNNSASAQKLLHSYEEHQHNRTYQSVMNIIMRANNELFQKEKDTMCEALLELMHDEIQEIAEEVGKERERLVQQQVIPVLLKAYTQLGLSSDEIISNLVIELNLSEETAKEYVDKYM